MGGQVLWRQLYYFGKGPIGSLEVSRFQSNSPEHEMCISIFRVDLDSILKLQFSFYVIALCKQLFAFIVKLEFFFFRPTAGRQERNDQKHHKSRKYLIF